MLKSYCVVDNNMSMDDDTRANIRAAVFANRAYKFLIEGDYSKKIDTSNTLIDAFGKFDFDVFDIIVRDYPELLTSFKIMDDRYLIMLRGVGYDDGLYAVIFEETDKNHLQWTVARIIWVLESNRETTNNVRAWIGSELDNGAVLEHFLLYAPWPDTWVDDDADGNTVISTRYWEYTLKDM